jgi:nitrite reductase/ring-hydroxylating ferredoxin subunit
MTDPTRRSVLVIAAAAACACAGCPLPTRAAPARGSTLLDVGPLKDFAREGVRDQWAASDGFFVVSRGGRVFAVSSHCTHKKVQLVPARNDDGFKCPRHGSTFDAAGKVIKSPARKPLPRFAIRRNDAGHLIVNPGSQFAEKEWDDPAAFVRTDR